MVRELGPPTWFVTLSAAEYDWSDMSHVLIKLNSDVDGYESMRNSNRCVIDPVFTSIHFHHQFSAYFRNVLCNKLGGPLGKVVDNFWRVEYQSRGAPHYHILLWIENAPRIGIDSPEIVLEFIQKYLTCRMPNQDKEPLLHKIISRYQVHKVCNSYCQRKRAVNGKYYTKCRFGFPRKLVDKAILHNPLETCKQRTKGNSESRLYELPRATGEERVNDYNPIQSLIWGANTDVQFIGENTSAVVNYVASYITKGEKSSLQKLWEEINNDKSLSKRIFKFCMNILSTRECGAYEACDILLGHHLYEKSRQTVWLCARKPNLRPRMLKTITKLQQVLEHNPDAVNKYENNNISDYYPNRPDRLQDVCLYDFVKFYDKKRVDIDTCNPKETFNMMPCYVAIKRTKPVLISHPVYRYPEQLEDYCYSLLLFRLPFRDESAELLDESGKSEPIFVQELLRNSKLADYHRKMSEYAVLIEKFRKEIHGEMIEDKGITDVLEPDALGEPLEVANAMAEFRMAMNVNVLSENLDMNLAKMNVDQKRIFNLITNQLQNKTKQMFMFISGAGGTGKNFLINTLKLCAQKFFCTDNTIIAVAAPTSLSACNINGMTIHRLLQLPVQHGSTEKYSELHNSTCKELSFTLKHVKILVIDEVSMVSNLMLAYIHKRLCQIFKNMSNFFGGVNVIVMGDLAQLTPVAASPIFNTISTDDVTNKLGGLCSLNLWQESITAFEELHISMRQKDDPLYAALLNRLRFGKLTNADIIVLQSHLIPIDNGIQPIEAFASFYLQLSKKGSSVVCLMSKSAMVSEFNQYLMSLEKNKIYELAAEDSFTFSNEQQKNNIDHARQLLKKREKNITETAGMESLLKLSVGCRVMLRRNINVNTGLVNGAIGSVSSFLVRNNYVEKIMVKFDNVSVPEPIERVKVRFNLTKAVTVVRDQFPVILSFAMTIHKSQGLSLDQVIVDVGNTVFEDGMMYVALSRVRMLSGLHLMNFDPSEAKANKFCVMEVNRLREQFNSTETHIVINEEKLAWAPDRIWCQAMMPKIIFIENLCRIKGKNPGRKRKADKPSQAAKDAKLDHMVHSGTNSYQIRWPKFNNKNPGTVCYSNAAFQVLFILPDFRNACISYQNSQNSVCKAVHTLYQQYEQRRQTGNNRKLFTSNVRKVMGSPFQNKDGGTMCARIHQQIVGQIKPDSYV